MGKIVILVFIVFILIMGCTADVTEKPADGNIQNDLESDIEDEISDIEVVDEESEGELLVNGKTMQERLDIAYKELHEPQSSHQIVSDFPDIQFVLEDDGSTSNLPDDILPFKYYYSKEADRTFNICNVERTVFICKGKMQHVISKADIDSGNCEITPIYKEFIK
jgi:hypothetical protein